MADTPAPYPADTKAKGWRFELDYEAIDQSGTWALAAQAGQEARPLLLMQWLVSWRQAPCGSLPPEEDVIAALIGINPKTWAKYRKVLMRGWWLAADGLMYHPTITARVLEMIDYRKKAAERVAKHKEAKRKQQAGNALPAREDDASNDTGTGTGTNLNTPPPPPREQGSIEVFPITAEWCPSEQFALLAKLAGLPIRDQGAMDAGLGEFKAYWLTQPHTVRTQIEWDNALVKSLKHEQVKAASSAGQRGGKPSRHTGFDTKDYTKGVTPDGSLI